MRLKFIASITDKKKKMLLVSFMILFLIICFYFIKLNGYKHELECIDANIDKVRLSDAKVMLNEACMFGYDVIWDDDELRKPARCVVKNAKKLFSYQSSIEVINDCTDEDSYAFGVFSNLLNKNILDRLEEAKIKREEQEYYNTIYSRVLIDKVEQLKNEINENRIVDSFKSISGQ